MKKTLLLITAFYFTAFPIAFATEPAKPARAILDYANAVIVETQEKTQQYAREMSGEIRTCLDTYGWKTVIGSRLQLGYDNFKETVTIVKDSACLLHDTGLIENRIMRLTRLVSESEISCIPTEAALLRREIEKLFYLRDALAKYGNLTPEDEARARQVGAHPLQKFEKDFGPLPSQLQGPTFSLSDEIYRNDALCTEPSSFFSFHQLKREFEALLFRLEEIKTFSSDFRGMARGFSAGETPGTSIRSELQTIRQEARRDAKAWFYENIRQPIEEAMYSDFESSGAPLIGKTKEELLRQSLKDETRVEDAVPTQKPLSEIAEDFPVREDVYSVLRLEEVKHDDSEEFLKMVSQDLVFMSEVSTEIGTESLEKETADLAPYTEEVRKFYEEINRLTTEVCAQHGSCE